MELENQYETSSSKTVILWRNDKSPDEFNTTNDIGREFNRNNVYKLPRRLSENYLYLIKKTANDLINDTIRNSEWTIQCTFKSNNTFRPNTAISGYENENETTCVNHIQQCKDRLFPVSNSDHSLLSDSGWLNENGMFDDHAAIMKIANHIKHNWNLDASYLFTVHKMNTSNTCDPTCHRYKVEFSRPTKECVIPQITVSAFFSVKFTYLLSLPVYVKYQLETDRRGYVVGMDSFNKKRFLHLFKLKRDAYIDINNYSGWSTEPYENWL